MACGDLAWNNLQRHQSPLSSPIYAYRLFFRLLFFVLLLPRPDRLLIFSELSPVHFGRIAA